MWLIYICLPDPLMTLYIVQSATYLAACIAVRYGHQALWQCYLASCLVHGALAAVHHLLLPH